MSFKKESGEFCENGGLVQFGAVFPESEWKGQHKIVAGR